VNEVAYPSSPFAGTSLSASSGYRHRAGQMLSSCCASRFVSFRLTTTPPTAAGGAHTTMLWGKGQAGSVHAGGAPPKVAALSARSQLVTAIPPLLLIIPLLLGRACVGQTLQGGCDSSHATLLAADSGSLHMGRWGCREC
jgi:hypothetical protein